MDMFTPLLLEVAAEIDTNPTSFYGGRGRGSLRLQTPVIGSHSALAMSVHPTYFDLATPLRMFPQQLASASRDDDRRRFRRSTVPRGRPSRPGQPTQQPPSHGNGVLL